MGGRDRLTSLQTLSLCRISGQGKWKGHIRKMQADLGLGTIVDTLRFTLEEHAAGTEKFKAVPLREP